MKVSESNVLDRRTFIKGMLAAGATVTVAACTPVAAPVGPTAAAPVAVTGPYWIHPKSLLRAAPGYGGAHLTWKLDDSVKWLPPEKIPADAAADALARLPKAKLEDINYKMVVYRTWINTWRDIVLTKPEPTMYRGLFARAGQEAIPAGVSANLTDRDYIASTHAGDHDLMIKGEVTDLKGFSAGALYRVTGWAKGYGGVMHMSNPSQGVLMSNGIVGTSSPLIGGAAWRAKVEKAGRVAVAYVGDGAVQSRYSYTTIRSAQNYKLPAVFVIENNFSGAGNPPAVLSPSPYLADYFSGMGLPAVVVDGNNVAQVYAAAKEAVDRARAGEGPTVIECLTFRWYDHLGFAGAKASVDGAFGMPYRTDDELKAWMARDPIVRFGAFLVERGLFTQAELDAMKAKAKAAVDDSITFARNSPEPKPEDGLKHVYTTGVVPATQFFGHPVVT